VAEGKLSALRLRIPFVSRQQRGPSGPPPALGGDLDSLLGAVARGEHGAFDLVYERLREPVYPAGLWDQTHEAAAEALDRERLARSLSELTGPQREVIALAYFGGHTHRQVAAILGAPVGTVKGRIREALIKLRHAMTSDD